MKIIIGLLKIKRRKTMRPVWNGAISFGLVNIPVDLISAAKTNDLKFHMMDVRNQGRIRYERVNEETGEEVPWNQIVKAYELSDDNYVLITDEDFEKADVKATKTIDIEAFVEKSDIEMIYYEKPYFIQPRKGGEKAYVLFREALEESGKVAIARVVIRTREYLSAILTEGDALVLDLLRFSQELRSAEDIKLPSDVTVKDKEKELALRLIDDMTEKWEPEKFKDEYRLSLMEMIRKKAEGMEIAVPEEEEEPESNVVDIMDLLRKSVDSKKAKTSGKSSEEESSEDKTEDKETGKTTGKKTAGKSSGKTAAAKKKAEEKEEDNTEEKKTPRRKRA